MVYSFAVTIDVTIVFIVAVTIGAIIIGVTIIDAVITVHN